MTDKIREAAEELSALDVLERELNRWHAMVNDNGCLAVIRKDYIELKKLVLSTIRKCLEEKEKGGMRVTESEPQMRKMIRALQEKVQEKDEKLGKLIKSLNGICDWVCVTNDDAFTRQQVGQMREEALAKIGEK